MESESRRIYERRRIDDNFLVHGRCWSFLHPHAWYRQVQGIAKSETEMSRLRVTPKAGKVRAFLRRVEMPSVTAHPNRNKNSRGANPSPAQIKEAREAKGLTQTEAAHRIYSTLRSWQDWEGGQRRMHPGLWELFLWKTRQTREFFDDEEEV